MSTTHWVDFTIVVLMLTGCGLWIWWEERERRRRERRHRRNIEEQIKRLRRPPRVVTHQEPTTAPSPLYTESDSGGNHTS